MLRFYTAKPKGKTYHDSAYGPSITMNNSGWYLEITKMYFSLYLRTIISSQFPPRHSNKFERVLTFTHNYYHFKSDFLNYIYDYMEQIPSLVPVIQIISKITPFIYNYLTVQNTRGLCGGSSVITKINNYVRSQLNTFDIFTK